MVEAAIRRKLATVVIADVVGYSRLMGRDEEGTLARFRASLRELIGPAIEAHGGTLINAAGDSCLRNSRASSRACAAPWRFNAAQPSAIRPCRLTSASPFAS